MVKAGIPVQYRLRVKQRLAVVRYAEAAGNKPAGRHFGLHYRTVRMWRNRWRKEGEAGLIPRYPERRRYRRLDERTLALIREARVQHRLGAGLARIWLERVHQIQISSRTLQQAFRDLGVPYLTKTPKRRPRQMKLFEKDEPGESVQADVKVIIRNRQQWFQYTAIDDCTRLRVLRLYRRHNQRSSLHFLEEIRDGLPFPVRKIQVDNGTEWSLAFALRCRELGIRVRYIKPRRPQQNGKVERSHRIDEQEFWSQHPGTDFGAATEALAAWAHRYNHDRFSMALRGRTPMEKLAAVLARRAAPPGSAVSAAIH